MKKAILALAFTLCSGWALTGQNLKMGISLGAAMASGELADYSGSSLMAGAELDYRLNPYLTMGMDFHYMGFPLDTSRLDFASTLMPLQLYVNLRWPLADKFYPYAGIGGGFLFVRYSLAHAVSVRQLYYNLSPRLGIQYEVNDELVFDLGFIYQQSSAQISRSGDGLELGLDEYSYWALSLGLSYAITGDY